MTSARGILLTGATGFVGGELLGRLLEREPQATVYCLVRARDAARLEQRRVAMVERCGANAHEGRVVALAGDVQHADLGLGKRGDELARQVDEVYHVAASTKFDLDLEDARRINREGTAHVLRFAQRARGAGGLRRLNHVSTAYVAGDRSGVIGVDDAEQGSHFRNTYEQTKWEGEQVLAAARDELPITCYRPSIVVGDSRNGHTLHFRVLYDPMRWVYSGKTSILPCRPETQLDVVPVDYVCDALLALAARPESAGGTYHLTAGPGRSLTIGEMVERAVAEGNRYHAEIGGERIEAPQIISPDRAQFGSDEERAKLEQLFALGEHVMRTHVPYMLTEQLFADPSTRALLAGSGIECPPLGRYYDRLVRYGVEHNFGDA